jgi:hypothetical protein
LEDQQAARIEVSRPKRIFFVSFCDGFGTVLEGFGGWISVSPAS